MQQLERGTVIDDRFEIVEIVGSGGMGVVYRAKQLGLEREVALKFLHDYLQESKDSFARFEREAVILQALVQKNINMFFCYGLWQGTKPYIAMEYLTGKTLETVLA